MKKFEEKTFNIPELKGISTKTIEEHLKLYSGYVRNSNLVMEKLGQLDMEKDAYIGAELFRRFSFEYNGMRNHEVYFAHFEGGAKELDTEGEFGKRIMELFGSMETIVSEFTKLASTRGVGWAMMWYDKQNDMFLASWVDEQHLGQLSNCSPILAIDMWEHSFVADYQPSGKKQYIEDFFANLNWQSCEENFGKALGK